MKKFSAFAVTSLFAVSVPALADSANHQLGFDYSSMETKIRETNLFSVDYGYFFQGLDLSKGPLAETEFLSQSSNIQGFIGGGTSTLTASGSDSDEAIGSAGVAGTAFFGDSGFFLSAGSSAVVIADDEADDSGYDETLSTQSIAAGYYFGDSTAVKLSYELSTLEIEDIDLELDETTYEVEFKTVQEIGSGMWLGGTAQYSDTLDSDYVYRGEQITALGVSFYPNRHIALGVAVEEVDYEAWWRDEESLMFTASFSFSSKTRLTLALGETEEEGSSDNLETFEANLNILF